jgi:hypothetical protein
VPADRLRSVLGIRRVEIVPERAAPSISDQALGA